MLNQSNKMIIQKEIYLILLFKIYNLLPVHLKMHNYKNNNSSNSSSKTIVLMLKNNRIYLEFTHKMHLLLIIINNSNKTLITNYLINIILQICF
jgi:hypothetical protein